MEDKDRELFQKTLDEMKVLEVELGAFRGEMAEFKVSVKERVSDLEDDMRLCQKNPETCSTARRLEEHIAGDKSKTARTTGIVGCIVACASFIFTFVTAVLGRK